MGKLGIATNLFSRLLVTSICIVLLSGPSHTLSDKRLCADENCKEIISLGTGKVNYHAGEEGMVSFKINSPIRIKSKSAGKDPSVWGVEVNGREGYAPKDLIREKKILISEKDLKFEVDVVKPGTEERILSTSEIFVSKVDSVETTRTKPLEIIPQESVEKPLPSTPTEATKIESVTVFTPVLMEIVDGTQIPKTDYDSDSIIESVEDYGVVSTYHKENISADNEDEDKIGDYDDDDVEEEVDDKQPTVESHEIKEAKGKENILQKDARNITTSEKLENSLTSNDDLVHNQKPQKSSEEVEIKDKNENIKDAKKVITSEKAENSLISNDDLVHNQKPQKSLEEDEIKDKNENMKDVKEVITSEKVENSLTFNDDLLHNQKPQKSLEEDEIKDKNENMKDVKKVVTSEKLENSLTSNEDFVQNQNSQKGTEENKIEEKHENTVKQVYEVNRNIIEETLVAKNSTIGGNKTEIQKLILANKNEEEQQESIVSHIGQNQHHNTNNDFKNEKGAKKENVKSLMDSKNTLPVEDKVTVTINKESGKFEEKDLPKANEPFNAITNPNPSDYIIEENRELEKANEPIRELFDNLPKLNNNPTLENTVDSKNKEAFTKTVNEDLKTNLISNNNIIDSNTPQENNFSISNDSNDIVDSIEQNEASTVADTNIHQANNLEELDLNIENVVSIKTIEEQERIHNNTISPQTVIEEINDMNTMPLEHQTDNQIEENKPQTKKDSSITTSSNTFTTSNNNEDLHLSSLTTEVTYSANAVYENSHNNGNPVPNSDLVDESVTIGYTSAEPLLSDTNTNFKNFEEIQTNAPPSTASGDFDIKENKGLFATIMGTVNSVLSINKKIKHNKNEDKHELDKILYSNIAGENKIITKKEENLQYCKEIGPNGECPHQLHEFKTPLANCDCSIMDTVFNSNLTFDAFVKALGAKVLEISEVLVFLAIVAAASLLFIFGYYCFCNSSREGALLSKLNQLESSLLASQKENAILKYNLMSTRQKLTSIEDNSFGSNDMVVSLKKDLEEELLEKARLQDQITALQKELENAADAGIELNKIVSELLSNQTGDESIISSVEELQKQLNEQQNTILEINTSLAEKSRENSELQLLLAEQNARYESELAILQRDNDELEHEKGNLLTRMEDLKNDFDKDITTALEGKNIEIKRLQNDILELNSKIESEHTKWQTSVAKVEALEECLKNVRKDPSVNITELIDVANVKAQLIESQKKYKTLKERFESEVDSRKLAENQLQIVSAEVEKLKQDFNQSEKDKLEAQTRLEVLSNYFKEKENQLQKELSLKEAIWLKQQGETTTTVDRLTAMQEEIQSLKSQNDSLRAEIEAQVAAHKAQTGTLENRAHETWLAARQSDRRYEEARAEATALRRKLTALAGGNINEGNKPSAGPITLSEDLTNVPSPIHMESPGSPMLGRMPPPPFLPPPFMGPPPPFIGLPPPPPFVPPGEMRPAPLGRIMSPPPQRSGRFSPQHLDYEDYLDYEGNNTWHRHTYSPPPRTYRSLSPTDSRYDYRTERDLMSTYDTETDFSPPPSPRESRRRVGNNSEKSDLSKNSNNMKRFNNKGPLSSGSEQSYNSPSHNDTKTKKSSTTGKSIV